MQNVAHNVVRQALSHLPVRAEFHYEKPLLY